MSYFPVAAVVVLGALMIINGTIMLVSPRAWFSMPSWLAGHGTLTRERYAAGMRAVQIRLIGAAMLGAFAYVAYQLLFGGRR